MAVIVQKMVNGDFSGVMFTIHPITKDKNKIVIESVPESGETLVSGRVMPSHYVIDKKSLEIEELKENKQKSLDNFLLITLAQNGQKIESLFNRPQDIEWTIKNGEIFFLQSRPISLN